MAQKYRVRGEDASIPSPDIVKSLARQTPIPEPALDLALMAAKEVLATGDGRLRSGWRSGVLIIARPDAKLSGTATVRLLRMPKQTRLETREAAVMIFDLAAGHADFLGELTFQTEVRLVAAAPVAMH